MMELKVAPYTQPDVIKFNFDELKAELAERVAVYKKAVYDETQITQAKADRADLNKLKKALNDERIRREKDYMVPFNEFKAQINEIIGIIDEPVALIDQQIKEYENREKAEKRAKIEEYFNGELKEDITTRPPEWLQLSQIWDDRWLNKSVSVATAYKDIKKAIEDIQNAITTLSELPKFSFEAIDEYKRSLNLPQAIQEGKRLAEIQERKEAAERARAEAEARAAEEAAQKAQEQPEPEPIPAPVEEEAPAKPKMWVEFRAELTTAQARELKAFFDERNIAFEAVRR